MKSVFSLSAAVYLLKFRPPKDKSIFSYIFLGVGLDYGEWSLGFVDCRHADDGSNVVKTMLPSMDSNWLLVVS